jgi:hypothetical protein
MAHHGVECPDVKTALTNPHLYKIWFYTFLCSACGGMMVPNIKNYGRLQISDDFTLTTIAALGSLGNGTLRIGFGFLMDRFPYRYIATVNLCF